MYVPLTVRDFLDRAEQVYPDRVAIVDEPEQPAQPLGELTYRRMAELARAQAARLDELGVPVGGRVAVISQNSARLLTAFFGVSGWGRVLVPVNFRLSAPEIEYIVRHSGADVVYADPSCAHLLDGLDAEHRFVLGDDAQLYREGVAPRPWAQPDEGATATINYTSGTTARPKGVELTHRNLWLNATVLGLHAGLSERETYLHVLPQFHVNGWGMPFGVTGLGGRHVILRQVDGAEILRRVEQHGVTLLCCAPAVINTVLDAAADWAGEIPGRDRVRVICAGAPPPTRTIERVGEELGWEFQQLYGLTETAPLLTFNRTRAEWDELPPAERAARLGRAGAPALGVRLALDADGEVLAATNHALQGYWQQPEETAKAQAGGWFHTGDGGRLDEDGYLVISDRKKDVIISGGENVSSIEVEDALCAHPAVREAAVIGTPDEKWGELVTALVVVADGAPLTEAELIAHCRTRLAGFKCPKRVEFTDSLPRTATGKLQKFKIREPYWAGRQRQVH
ncbi:AMP-binding protein [Kitasatospora acidiphila]|uniref:AMP-binding protein n=1 Tax=Kitasatospora acidiphila TaxID=2567942 RepID=A0A540WDG7_9ACTN|nr:AMP-binding protein [Kitasatospora acidiphila]TQF07008.1 AMP-binding protein [Kitasatospora acidiphila]